MAKGNLPSVKHLAIANCRDKFEWLESEPCYYYAIQKTLVTSLLSLTYTHTHKHTHTHTHTHFSHILHFH